MTMDEYQKYLPAGLKLQRGLKTAINFVHEFSAIDSRGAVQKPLNRIVCFLPRPEEVTADWQKPFWGRMQNLLTDPWPYVVAPREVVETADGTIYLVCDEMDPLSVHIPDHGFDQQTNDEILEQLLIGLAALHRRGITHGDLRPRNVFVELTNKGKVSTAWIGNVAIGGLTLWSRGAMVSADSEKYYPHRKTTEEPTHQDDLYALGVLARELTQGSTNTPVLHQSKGMPWTWFWERITGTAASGLIRLLLQDESQRPRDAGEVLKKCRRLRSWTAWRRKLMLVVIASILCIGVLFIGWWKAVEERSQVEKVLNTELGKTKSATEEDRKKSQQITDLKNKVSELEKRPKRQEPSESKEAWGNAWRKKGTYDKEAVQTEYERLTKGDKKQQEAAKLLADWQKNIERLKRDSEPWFEKEPQLKELFQSASLTPWSTDDLSQAIKHLDNLDVANATWNQWAGGGHPFEELEKLIPTVQNPEAEKLLTVWLAQFREKKSWSIYFKKGTAPPGFGKDRALWVHSSGEWSKKNWHTWDADSTHTYRPGHAVDFKWKAGEPLEIAMEGPRSAWRGGYRPYMIYKTIDGPLAVWQAHKLRQISEGGISLEFEVLNCPGPPRKKLIPIP